MRIAVCVTLGLLGASPRESHAVPLPGTQSLTTTGDMAELLMAGAHRFIERKVDESVAGRAQHWRRDLSSRAAYEKSVEQNRQRFRTAIGVVDPRLPPDLERFSDGARPAIVAETAIYRVVQVRWPVLDGVWGEGLLAEPRSGKPAGHVVVLPDADQTPEQLFGLAPGLPAACHLAASLASAGLEVLVPVLVSRGNEFSGNPLVTKGVTMTHREWIYRQAFHMGRHVIGYEVQKILALVDGFARRRAGSVPIAVAGYGEGGLLALYAAAADSRIDGALVSGYFGPRQRVWDEPLYRNVWGLLREFGDAELATLVAPRPLVVEHAEAPVPAKLPDPPAGVRAKPAVGKLITPDGRAVVAEGDRIDTLVRPGFQPRTVVMGEGRTPVPFGSPKAVRALLDHLGIRAPVQQASRLTGVTALPASAAAERQRRTVKQLEAHVQALIRDSERVRNVFMTDRTTLMAKLEPRAQRFRMRRVAERPAAQFADEIRSFREIAWREVLGKIDDPVLPFHARTRQTYDTPRFTGYEVVLDVFPDVITWGFLLVPKDIRPGERRPVVIAQHGRNGVPMTLVEREGEPGWAAKLANEGFVTFAPHNLYRGEDAYRMLNRKGNPLKLSLFSIILAQHRQLLRWLGGLPMVDKARIGFYGISYGGETAVRVPPLLEEYALSICSADFNDWARKVASTDSDYSFMYTEEWEMPYFNMGNTFNYAELAYLMVPRPFMVERGHHDGVAPDTWVASEYAKVRWVYTMLGLGDRTEMEMYNGGHIINGEGTFEFLRKHLRLAPRVTAAR